MAWTSKKAEDQRKEFITAYQEKQLTMTEICHEFGISRKTGYKWISRFATEGTDGLRDQSKARHTQSQKVSEGAVHNIIEIKQRYGKWGPKKILAFLERHQPEERWPSATTIGKILDTNGLVIPRKYRKRFPLKSNPLSHCQKPNDIWSLDFKGWFKTKEVVLKKSLESC